jgi:hypothetical protein
MPGSRKSLRRGGFQAGSGIAPFEGVSDRMDIHAGERGTGFVRRMATVLIVLAVVLASYLVGRASEREETTITVQVTSADHEVEEGYFSLGDGAALMVRPGTEIYRFLSRQKGQNIRITLTETARPEPSRIER